jgi:hypothetical protein
MCYVYTQCFSFRHRTILHASESADMLYMSHVWPLVAKNRSAHGTHQILHFCQRCRPRCRVLLRLDTWLILLLVSVVCATQTTLLAMWRSATKVRLQMRVAKSAPFRSRGRGTGMLPLLFSLFLCLLWNILANSCKAEVGTRNTQKSALLSASSA